jgi:PQQ-like domain
MPSQRRPALLTLSLIGAALFVLSACGGGAADVVNTAADSGTSGSTGSTGSGSTGTGSGSGGTGGTGGTGGSGGTTTPTPGTDVVTYKNDVARTGQNLTEATLTLTNVTSATFGLLRTLVVDGKVDAQPLYLSQLTVAGAAHNVVFVATENDSVYAFDSDTGATLWHVSLLPSGETTSDTHGCGQVTPAIGVTSTPVIDRSAGTNGAIYVVAMSKDSSSAYHQRLHALDVTTGAELFNGPVTITGTYTAPGSVATTFEPGQYEERAALLLSQGIVYTSFTSHCDGAPYAGWMMGYGETTLAQTSVLNIAPNSNSGPAIWMSGGGPGADSSGNIYLLSANGAFETTLDANGFPNKQDYGNSFLRLAATGTTLTVADYFTMSNEVAESNSDQDLGSGGELILPDLTDSTNTVRHLVVGAGKDGNIYVVNRDSMGKFNASSNNIWQQLSGALPGGIWSTPAYFNGTLYYGDSGATLKAFAITNAKLGSSPSSQSPSQFPFPGTAPAVSANGTANGIVWTHQNSSPQAVLHAYDAGNLAHELYNSSQAANNRDQFGAGNKFITPTIADGKVFVGTQKSVAVFGLLQ